MPTERALSGYYFRDPRLMMSGFGRFIVRLVTYFVYALLLALCIVFCLSELPAVHALGLLVGLFLLTRLLDLFKPELPLSRVNPRHLNIIEYSEPATLRLLESAVDRASLLGGDLTLHILEGLMRRTEIRTALTRMDINPRDLHLKLEEYLQKSRVYTASKKEMLVVIERLMLLAFRRALNHYGRGIAPTDCMAAIAEMHNDYVDRLFLLFEIEPGDLASALIFTKKTGRNLAGFFNHTFRVRHRVMNRAWTARPTPFLDSVSVDITDRVRSGEGGFLIGHASEYERLTDVLSRPGNPNALLVGEPGVGKETIVAHLAFEMIHDRVPAPLFDKRLVSLEIGSLVSGADEGELQKRVQRVLSEITTSGNIILYIPDIHTLVKASGSGQLTAADTLIPAIKSGSFSVIGVTFPREFKEYIEPHTDFTSAFEQIRVQEISEQEATQILIYQSLLLEGQVKNITISFGAVKKCVYLAHKYFRQKLLPASAENLLKEALADAAAKEKTILSAEDIVSIAEKKVNIPMHAVAGGEAADLLKLEEHIHQKFIDQNEAVSSVSRSLREYRSGLSRTGGPIATFLFVGPTGVGKTELSKILAEIQFGSKEMMTRLDMSEYQDKQSFFRLIGSPDGTVSGALTESILARPYSLVLLDEFEKAHPDILNIFLQVFDDGRLTDNLGRVVDFQNTIIIATSNAHSQMIKEELEKGTPTSQVADLVKKKLTDYFKPELLNRFSDIIVFKSLSKEDIRQVAKLNVGELIEAMKTTHGVDLIIEESAITALSELGYDPVFGARPLRNVISARLRSVLADQILKGQIAKGGAISVQFEGGEFHFVNK